MALVKSASFRTWAEIFRINLLSKSLAATAAAFKQTNTLQLQLVKYQQINSNCLFTRNFSLSAIKSTTVPNPPSHEEVRQSLTCFSCLNNLLIKFYKYLGIVNLIFELC